LSASEAGAASVKALAPVRSATHAVVLVNDLFAPASVVTVFEFAL
jgi:hypothetical protein